VHRTRKARKGRSLFFIDLAVPRDIDPGAGELDGVFLYNVDDLSKVVAESMDGRKREAARAEQIVDEEAASYDRWAEAEHVTPTIVALRERLRGILESEVDRSLSGKLRHLGPSDREALLVMVEAALNKMLHPATTRLRRMAVEPTSRVDLDQAVSALRDLFEFGEGGTFTEAETSDDTPSDPSVEPLVEPESGSDPPRRAGAREAR
jgi:glutamyl-tRNA reductase